MKCQFIITSLLHIIQIFTCTYIQKIKSPENTCCIYIHTLKEWNSIIEGGLGHVGRDVTMEIEI